ncbi:MAG: hypothetical protein HYY76_08485 [Acidobacteria bacterium]|nr:hypothetical protein [Acidobacteriota bacterium]
MLNTAQRVWPAVLLAVVAAACSRADDAPPVATPTLVLSSRDAAIGSPFEMTYRFAVAPDAPPFAEDHWVFVHFIDNNGELMWTDDHEPPTPTRQWKPGSTIEYRRTMFIPKFPYVGETQVEIGLFLLATGERLPLAGETVGQRAYRAATFNMRLQTDNLFVVFRDGWHETEVGGDGTGREWQWSRKEATLAFRNPGRDVRFYLEADQPGVVAFHEPQRVELRIGDAVIDAFFLPPTGQSDIRRIDIPASRLGAAETVEMTISVDKTFVPAEVPALKSTDPRELGVRVFRAFVQPM